MADLVINVRDMSVAKNNPINIAVINEPNPVSNFTATADQVYLLMNIPKYKITDSSGKIVNGENYYTFFPEKKPGGGGGGGTTEKNGFVTAGMLKVISGASTKQVKTGVFEFEPIN